MQANEIIAIMRHKGWLTKEPLSTREKITSSVRYMMVKTGTKNPQLAQELRVSASYIRRKLSEHRWALEDLDELPRILGHEATDYVGGYRRMAQIDDEEALGQTEESDSHE
jgi:hypothetical protein